MVDRVSNEDAEVCAHNHVGTAGRDMILALLDERNALAKQRDELAAEVERLTKRLDQEIERGGEKSERICKEQRRAEKAEAERDAALARAGAAAVEMRERALVAVSKSDSQEMDICGAAAIAIRIAALPIPTDAQAALDKLLREAEQRGQIKAGGVFADNDPEARYIEDMQNACPACGGSGHNDDAQAALDKLIADARADAFRDAAELVKKHPMRFAGQTEAAIRASLSVAILARINEPQEGGA